MKAKTIKMTFPRSSSLFVRPDVLKDGSRSFDDRRARNLGQVAFDAQKLEVSHSTDFTRKNRDVIRTDVEAVEACHHRDLWRNCSNLIRAQVKPPQFRESDHAEGEGRQSIAGEDELLQSRELSSEVDTNLCDPISSKVELLC